jgi:hypothetical protein
MTLVNFNFNRNMSTKEVVACVFCGSKHQQKNGYIYCYDPKLKHLERMEYCMAFEECPKFDVYPINELRYIAFHYARYQKAIPSAWHTTLGNRYNRAFGYAPISLTLSKNRMVKALVDRWNGFATFREKKTSSPTQEVHAEECPICMEQMLRYYWSDKFARIAMQTKGYGVVTTRCKHTFCGGCWGNMLKTNVKRRGYVNHVWDNTECLACPLCRAEIVLPRSTTDNLDLIANELLRDAQTGWN